MMNCIDNLTFFVDVCAKKLKIYLRISEMLNVTFYGELEFSYFERLSKQLEFATFDECKNESISALTTFKGLPQFEYRFNASTSRFVWIKKVKECPFGLYYGMVDMVPCERAAAIMLYVNLANNFMKHSSSGEDNVS